MYAFYFSPKGELILSSHMEVLPYTLFCDDVPDTWTKSAYPSTALSIGKYPTVAGFSYYAAIPVI